MMLFGTKLIRIGIPVEIPVSSVLGSVLLGTQFPGSLLEREECHQIRHILHLGLLLCNCPNNHPILLLAHLAVVVVGVLLM